MSLFSVRSFALSALVAAALALSGCTMAPVHANRAATGTSEVQLSYAKPTTRLEQVFYQALSARLGTSGSDLAPHVTASVSASASRIGISTRTEPVSDYQVIAVINYRIESNGEILSSGTRTATSGFRTTAQVLADDIAQQNAEEDAVRTATQSVIAAILSDPALR